MRNYANSPLFCKASISLCVVMRIISHSWTIAMATLAVIPPFPRRDPGRPSVPGEVRFGRKLDTCATRLLRLDADLRSYKVEANALVTRPEAGQRLCLDAIQSSSATLPSKRMRPKSALSAASSTVRWSGICGGAAEPKTRVIMTWSFMTRSFRGAWTGNPAGLRPRDKFIEQDAERIARHASL
jgi:hypothetical protein